MSPSRDHEVIKSRIGRLLEAWCTDRGIEFEAVGSWTIKKKAKRRSQLLPGLDLALFASMLDRAESPR